MFVTRGRSWALWIALSCAAATSLGGVGSVAGQHAAGRGPVASGTTQGQNAGRSATLRARTNARLAAGGITPRQSATLRSARSHVRMTDTAAAHGNEAGSANRHPATPGDVGSPQDVDTAPQHAAGGNASTEHVRSAGPRGPPASHEERIAFARETLGVGITDTQAAAIERAHHVGDGELGRDGVRFACVGNYTPRQIAARARILRSAGFDRAQTRALLESGIVGDPDGETARNLAHESLTTDLYNGQVVSSEPFSANGNRTALYRVQVRNPATGRTRTALFKLRTWGDNEGWNRTPVEYVAYELNRMLGMDYVPPVAYRRDIDVHFERRNEGAMVRLVPEARALDSVPERDWGVRKDLLLSDTRILDVLIQNSDRHRGNFLIGRHWATGRMMPVLIDHGAGFRPGASVTMTHDNAFMTGPVRVVRRSTLGRLRQLSFQQLKRKFGEFLSDGEIGDVLQRRDGIVRYFEDLIRTRGESNVVADVDDF